MCIKWGFLVLNGYSIYGSSISLFETETNINLDIENNTIVGLPIAQRYPFCSKKDKMKPDLLLSLSQFDLLFVYVSM